MIFTGKKESGKKRFKKDKPYKDYVSILSKGKPALFLCDTKKIGALDSYVYLHKIFEINLY